MSKAEGIFIIGCLVSAAIAAAVTANGYRGRIAEAEAQTARALQAAHEKNAKGVANATNTILLAESAYEDLRAERDRLLARLRHTESGGRPGDGDSVEALRARVAKLEELVGRMAETASRCGDGFERCAQKHDAIVEIVK